MIEACCGYPDWLYCFIGHPVTWMGASLSFVERHLNRTDRSFAAGRIAGSAALVLLLIATGGIALALTWIPGAPGLLIAALAAATLPAQRSLHQHVLAVADELDSGGLAAGRAAVSRIVGRNPAHLDEAGVARAAIESLAENFADGVVAPAFWMIAAGLPGGALYKAINTADSMIGHRSARYLAFGWAAARLDDLVNLPASRLAALWILLAASVCRANARNGLRAMLRDARRHRSPNAGWPEAAMAGVLELALNGPRVYGDTPVEDAFMGDGRRDATAADIRRGLRVYRTACAIQLLVIALAVIALR